MENKKLCACGKEAILKLYDESFYVCIECAIIFNEITLDILKLSTGYPQITI